MKVLLDESLPRQLAPHLPEHGVVTVQAQGWSAAENGALLRAAAPDLPKRSWEKISQLR